MTVITIFEALLFIISASLVALLSYWIGTMERKSKKLFIVANRNFVEGYFNCEKKAERCADDINLLISESGEKSYIDKSPYFVKKIETAD